MKRTVNYKFVAVLLAVGAILSVSVHFLHGFQTKRNAHALKTQASIAKEKGELARSLFLLDRYLRMVPMDATALFDLGMLAADHAEKVNTPKQRATAFFVLNRVLLKEDSLEAEKLQQIRRKLLGLAMSLDRFEEARAQVDKLLGADANEKAPALTAKERAELQFVRALSYKRERQYPKAEQEFKAAAKTDPSLLQAYAERAHLLRDKIDNPSETPNKVLDAMIKANKDSFEAYLIRADYLLGDARRDPKALSQAEKSMEEAKRLAPRNAGVLLTLGRLAWELGDKERAREVFRDGIKADPNNQDMYVTLARLEARDGNIKEAHEVLDEGLERLTHKEHALSELANLALQENKVEEAEKVIEKLKAAKYSDRVVKFHLARVHMLNQKWGAAAEILGVIRELLFDYPAIMKDIDTMRGLCFEKLGSPDQALTAYQNAVSLDPAHLVARVELAQTLLKLNRFDTALKEYIQAETLSERLTETLSERLRAASNGKDKDRIRKEKERISKLSAEISLAVARLLTAQNQRLPPDERDWRGVNERLAKLKDGIDVTLLRISVRLLGESDEEARARWLRDPKAPKLSTAEVQKILEARKAKARELLEKERKDHPEHARIWIELALLDAREKKTPAERQETMLRGLDNAAREPRLKDSRELLLERLRFLPGTPDAVKKLNVLEKTITSVQGEKRPVLLSALANAYLLVRDNDAAVRVWQALAKEQPHNLEFRLVLFDLARGADESRARLDEIQKLEGKATGAYWRYGEASLIVSKVTEDLSKLKKELAQEKGEEEAKAPTAEELEAKRPLAQAREYLGAAAKVRPSWHRVPALLGRVELLDGRGEDAISAFQEAVRLGDGRLSTVGPLARLLQARGRIDEASKAIETFIGQEDALVSAGLGHLATYSLLRRNNQDMVDSALRMADKTVSAKATDYKEHVWLGRILLATGKYPRAKEELEKACSLAPEQPETWESLVLLYARMDQKDHAKKAIDQAAKSLPADRADLPLARCHELVGDLKAAEKHFEAALDRKRTDLLTLENVAAFHTRRGNRLKAGEFWEKIAKREDAEPDQRQRARRNLALALGLDQDYERFTEALKLLEKNLSEKGKTQMADMLAKALLLSARPGHRDEAIRMFEEMDSEHALPSDHRFALAQLYAAAGNWPKTELHMRTLLGTADKAKKSPTHYSFFIRQLLNRGKSSETQSRLTLRQAEAWLARMETDFPPHKFLATLATKARVLQAQKNSDETITLLKDLSKREKVDVGGLAALVESLAGETKGQGVFRDLAESLYREKVHRKADQGSLLALAGFLGRNKRVDEAFACCEQALAKVRAEKGAPGTVIAVALGVLRASHADPKYGQRVETWLREWRQEKTESVVLLGLLADLRDWQERFGDAADLYQQMLAKQPRSLVALNNRAWILAHQSRTDEALELIQAAVTAFGPIPEILDTRGVIYLLAGKTENAVKDLEASVAGASSPTRLFHLAEAYHKAGKFAEAAQKLKEAKEPKGAQELKEAKELIEAMHPMERPRYQRLVDGLKEKGQAPVRAAGG